MGSAFFIRFREYFGLYLCDFVYFSSLIMYNESIDTVLRCAEQQQVVLISTKGICQYE